MADVSIAGAPTAVAASCHPVMQGWTPPLVGPRHWPGESLLRASVRLGLLLCYNADAVQWDFFSQARTSSSQSK
jgi:hypothetical protein